MDNKFLSYEIEFNCDSSTSKQRWLYWRIKPSQLNWFERLFKNHWHQLRHECCGEWNRYFTSSQFIEWVKPCKTVSDILSYIVEQRKLIDERNTRSYHGWPVNLNE